MTDAAAPGSLIALRVPVVLATAGGVVVAGLIARELGCDRRAQGFTAAAQATGVWTTLFGHWLTPYTLEPVHWLLVIWLLVRWVRLCDDRLLLALGVVTGVALTKFQVLLLCVVLAVAVAAVGPRELAVLGRDLAAVAHLDGVLKPLRRVNRAGRTGSSFQLRAEGVSDGSVVTRGA